jgi:iron complex transport system substrate-binding protein
MLKLGRTLAALAVISLMLLAAACADDDEEAPPEETATPAATPTASPAQPEDAAADGFPVTIEHKFGATTIEKEPQRVISLGYSEQDPLLALGVVPIAIREWFGEQPHAVWPWAQDELGDGEPEVLNMPFGELDFEAIAALKPDLIVATHSGIREEEYATLAEIAPTLAQPGEYPDFGVPWQEQTILIGRAVGREDVAERLVADVEAQIQSAANGRRRRGRRRFGADQQRTDHVAGCGRADLPGEH